MKALGWTIVVLILAGAILWNGSSPPSTPSYTGGGGGYGNTFTDTGTSDCWSDNTGSLCVNRDGTMTFNGTVIGEW